MASSEIQELIELQPKTNFSFKHLPGKEAFPFGLLLGFRKDPSAVVRAYFKQFGPVFRANFGPMKVVFALGPECSQQILQDPQDNFSSMMGYELTMGFLFRGGLMLRDFDDHRQHRRIMQSAFKKTVLNSYLEATNRICSDRIDEWGRQIDFSTIVKTLTLEVAAKNFMGMDYGNQDYGQLLKNCVDLLRGVMSIVRLDIPGLQYHRSSRAKAWLNAYYSHLIPQKRHSDDEDIFAHFCRERTEEGEYFPDDAIVAHIIFLFLAAHDTTTTALEMLMYHLAAHPQWQEKAREQCLALGSQQVSFDGLATLSVIDNALKETLRLYPPVGLIIRRTVRETTMNNLVIPPNTMIYQTPYFNHQMPEIWRDPHLFDPDRFAPGREEDKQHPFAWIPFGGGAHKCIGVHFATMEIKVILHQILTRYRCTLPTSFKFGMEHFPVPSLTHGLPLVLDRLD